MWTQRLLWLFIMLLADISLSAAIPPIEDSEMHDSQPLSHDFQEENNNSFAVLSFQIESIPPNYLRQKQNIAYFIYRFKNNLQIMDCGLSSILYLEHGLAIGLRLPSHSIGYPFHTFP